MCVWGDRASADGVLYNADIIIANGTIEQVGVGLVDPTPGVTIVIDATNKYITPGLVDLHRCEAASACTHAVLARVRQRRAADGKDAHGNECSGGLLSCMV